MDRWELRITKSAEKDFSALSKVLQRRVTDKLTWLEQNFDDITPLTLANEWAGFYKLRVGDHRVIYRVDWGDEIITVEAIDHRSKIYKRKT